LKNYKTQTRQVCRKERKREREKERKREREKERKREREKERKREREKTQVVKIVRRLHFYWHLINIDFTGFYSHKV
jgi:hypothetical protein